MIPRPEFPKWNCAGKEKQLVSNHFAMERLTSPILADEGKHAVFDLIPLAGSRWQVANQDLQPRLVSQFLQFHFP
jgi:hypothetical protein